MSIKLKAAGLAVTAFAMVSGVATMAQAQQLNHRPGEAGYTGLRNADGSLGRRTGADDAIERAQKNRDRGTLVGQSQFGTPAPIQLSAETCFRIDEQLRILTSGGPVSAPITYNNGEQGTYTTRGNGICQITPKRGM